MSVLNSIRKVYLELSKQSKAGSDMLTLICNNTLDKNFEGSITDALSNAVLSVDYNSDSNLVILGLAIGDTVVTTDRGYDLTNVEFTDAIDDIISSAGYSDIISSDRLMYNTNQYGEIYALLGEVSQGYLTRTRQGASQLIAVVQSKEGVNSTDREKIISAIQCSQNDGNVTQEAWLSILSNVCKSTHDQPSGSTMTPVSGSPFFLTSVLQIVTTVVSSVMSAVLSILTVVLQGIWKLITIALQGLLGLTKYLNPANIEINVDDNTDYVKGSNCLIFKTYDNILVSATYTGPDKEYYVPFRNGLLNSHPGIDMYFWQQSQNDFIINGRMVLNVEPTRFHDYLTSKIVYTKPSDVEFIADITSDLYPLPEVDAENSIYLTNEESIRMKYDADYADRVMFASLCAMGLPFIMYSGKIRFKNLPLQGNLNFNIYDLGCLCATYGFLSDAPNMKQSKYVDLYRTMWKTILEYCQNSVVADWNRATHQISSTNLPSVWYSAAEQYGYNQLNEVIPVWAGCTAIWSGRPDFSLQFIFNDQYNLNMPRFVVDAVPDGYTFIPAQFSVGDVIAAVTTIALVATATFIAGKIIRTAVSNKSRISQLTRTNEINRLRQAYLNSPTKENAKALNKAVNKYNRVGGMLGWDSYDLTNNWYSPRSSTVTSTGSDLQAGMDVTDSDIRYIAKLIKG